MTTVELSSLQGRAMGICNGSVAHPCYSQSWRSHWFQISLRIMGRWYPMERQFHSSGAFQRASYSCCLKLEQSVYVSLQWLFTSIDSSVAPIISHGALAFVIWEREYTAGVNTHPEILARTFLTLVQLSWRRWPLSRLVDFPSCRRAQEAPYALATMILKVDLKTAFP